MKEYGYFRNQGSEFIITTLHTPRHWYNCLYNDNYITFTSQVGYGESLIQGHLGRRILLTDNRQVYILGTESGQYWTANGLPVKKEYQDFFCVHGTGYTEIFSQYIGTSSSFHIFVSQDTNEEIWSIKVKNTSNRIRTIKVIPYAETKTDGVYRPQGYNVDTAGSRPELNGVATRSYTRIQSENSQEVSTYFLADREISRYDTKKNAFIGTYGNEQEPDALAMDGCAGSCCIGEKICLALEHTVTLRPGEDAQFHCALGAALASDELKEAACRNSARTVEQRLMDVREQYAAQEDGVIIHIPDEPFNCLINFWTKHQTNMGSRWTRVCHNGYRDMVSDSECLASFNPQLAWERFKRTLTFQYSNGYVPRTWLDGEIRNNNFADRAVWIPMTAASVTEELGDVKCLEESVLFNDGSEASVYEHVKRAADFLRDSRGIHGLIKLWDDDWNDMMNQAGLEGRGSSVWPPLAWCRANERFGALALAPDRKEDLFFSWLRGQEMKDIINETGWDGEYYIDAFNNQGEPLGSMSYREGKIYLTPQLWAVLAQVAEGERKQRIIDAVDKYLETDLGTLVSWPAYHSYVDTIGQMTQEPAGVHEDGGVYLHPCCWKLVVDSMQKDNQKVQMGLQKILSFHHEYHKEYCESYIMYNSYFTEETGYRLGTMGQAWRSATGAWLTKALFRYVPGLKAEILGLHLEPRLSPDWKECSVTKEFRGAVYNIRYTQTEDHGCNRIASVMVNGPPWTEPYLPCGSGMVYEVNVRLVK